MLSLELLLDNLTQKRPGGRRTLNSAGVVALTVACVLLSATAGYFLKQEGNWRAKIAAHLDATPKAVLEFQGMQSTVDAQGKAIEEYKQETTRRLDRIEVKIDHVLMRGGQDPRAISSTMGTPAPAGAAPPQTGGLSFISSADAETRH